MKSTPKIFIYYKYKLFFEKSQEGLWKSLSKIFFMY